MLKIRHYAKRKTVVPQREYAEAQSPRTEKETGLKMLLRKLAPKSHRLRHDILVVLFDLQKDNGSIKRLVCDDIRKISMRADAIAKRLRVTVSDISAQVEALLAYDHAEAFAIENDPAACMYFCNSKGIGAIAEQWHLREGRDAGYKTWTIALAYVAIPSTILSTALGTWQYIRSNSLQERIELLEDIAAQVQPASTPTIQGQSSQIPPTVSLIQASDSSIKSRPVSEAAYTDTNPAALVPLAAE